MEGFVNCHQSVCEFLTLFKLTGPSIPRTSVHRETSEAGLLGKE